tara:strand:+ start:1680 stop:7868 length:6189 start_codon:yes stop_codon:yes gene_type:complete
MPEIKHTFTAGKMNKDLDERLVQNGEYRDALNVQVRTTGGDSSSGEANSGTVQNIKGNKSIGETHSNSSTKVVAAVTDEKTDKAYFFFAAPAMQTDSTLITTKTKHIDSIMEQDVDGTDVPVVIDIWGITQPAMGSGGVWSSGFEFPIGDFIELEVDDASDYRVGMTVEALDDDSDVVFSGKIEQILITTSSVQNDVLQLYNPVENTEDVFSINDIEAVRFSAERVLSFNPINLITGINVIDDLLFWTDSYSEPKKINITRCKAGCVSGANALTTHTKLMLKDPQSTNQSSLVTPSTLENNNSLVDDLLERHITVIRKAPRTAPTLHMSTSGREGNTSASIIEDEDGNGGYYFLPGDVGEYVSGEEKVINYTDSFVNTDWREGDILIFTHLGSDPIELEAKFITYETGDDEPSNEPTNRIRIEMLFDSPSGLSSWMHEWNVALKQRRPLFETKFPRFGYRYKYEDGEYSSFSPWSELAFMPGQFDYKPKKGHNLGMENEIRELTIKDFIPYRNRDIDITAVDILYKTTDSPNVYVVKTITRGVDGEWELFTPNETNDFEPLSGELTITSEMVHKVLPQNQTLRSWDNVPRYALAQEIVGNRLLFANYVQGYTLPIPVGLKQSITSVLLQDGLFNPVKSIKSIRDYKIGMVFGDKYGRETPVVEYGYITGNENNRQSLSGGVNVEKEFASFKNKFKVTQDWSVGDETNGEPPSWADYVKYYVKETSSEYYNLIMDRWYWADNILDDEQKNVWISFNSADRNKVDLETYLILKNQHGQDGVVTDEARYKILAIENQAPKFIKTELREIGEINGLENDGDEGNSNIFSTSSTEVWDDDDPATENPHRLVDETDCEISLGRWNNLFGPTTNETDLLESNMGRMPSGRVRVRVIAWGGSAFGKTIKTSWRNIVHWTMGFNGDSMKIVWDKKWGDEAAMFTRFTETWEDEDGFSLSTLTYGFEFEEEVVLDKPEFEGRFFVKIENDAEGILEDNVLLTAEQSFEFMPTSTHKLSYIDSTTTNPAQQGPYGGEVAAFDDSTRWNSSFDGIDITNSYYNWANWGCTGVAYAFPEQENCDNNTTDFWGTCTSCLDENDPEAEVTLLDGTVVTTDGSLSDLPNWTWYTSVEEGFASTLWRSQTKNFWQSYDFDASNGGAGKEAETLFIDAAHAHTSGGFTQGANPDNLEEMTGSCIGGSGLPRGNRYKSTGLDQGDAGSLDDGTATLGRMVLSHTKMDEDRLKHYSSSAYNFWTKMKDPGTYFWFTDDTSASGGTPQVYKTVANGGYDFVNTAMEKQYNYASLDFQSSDPLCISHRCYDQNTSYHGCSRRSTRIEFRLVDKDDGGFVKNENGEEIGIIPTEFDPRGHARHDGGTKMNVQILNKYYEGGGQIVPKSNAAVWETESKESVDLDLYYEASNAIPMKLNVDNAFNYIPVNSDIIVKRKMSNNSLIKAIPLNGVLHRVTNIIPSDTKQIIELKSSDSTSFENPYLHTTDVAIGDHIEFLHNDGLITRSKITNFFKKQTGEVISDASELSADSSGGLAEDVNGNTVFPSDFYDTLIPQTSIEVTIKKINFMNLLELVQFGPPFASAVEGEGPGSQVEAGMALAGSGNGSDGVWFDIDNESIIVNNVVFQSNIYSGSYVGDLSDTSWMTLNVEYVVQVPLQRTGYYEIDNDVWKYPVTLSWFNCYSFGNGVESDRIRDDFNAPIIDNGVKVSTTFSGYKKEEIKSGMIYSGLYNSKSEVNDLNEFNMAEKITKNLNPSYGSIQALRTRDTDVVVLTEDKALRVLANKDAVFNADGNMQLTATDKVLGTTVPFVGDYGISQNPESLAWDQYRIYFTDKQRGAVLRLSQDGLTPISNVGMKTWFRENLKTSSTILGTFDAINGEYNITLDNPATTISFNEASKGWVSFKSFLPEAGVSISGNYITAKSYKIWDHYRDDVSYNNFYDTQYESTINVLFNDQPSSIKSFKSINYEGSQARVNQYTESTVTDAAGNTLTDLADGEYYNLNAKTGWYINSFATDLQTGTVPEFINKEHKWFNKINGEASTSSNLDTNEFTTQGLGSPSTVSSIYF